MGGLRGPWQLSWATDEALEGGRARGPCSGSLPPPAPSSRPPGLPSAIQGGGVSSRSHTHERCPKVDEEQVSLTTVLKALNAFERGGDRVSVIFRKKKEDLPSRKKQNLEE